MSERRTYLERRSYSAAVMRWRKSVYDHPKATNGCKLLLLRLADDMAADRKVSVPRSVLAEDLDVAPARITEWISQARAFGFLDQVRRARPKVTAVYQGIYPSPGVRGGVPQDLVTKTASEVRESRPLEVREGVPLDDVQRYALGGSQEVVVPARIAQALPGSDRDEAREEGVARGGALVSGAFAVSIDCPHGVRGGQTSDPWADNQPACPDCAREARRSA